MGGLRFRGWLDVTNTLTWRRTWEDKPLDFAAYDGERRVGRIYQLVGGPYANRWFWVVTLFDDPVYWSRKGNSEGKDEAVQAVKDAYAAYIASRSA
jgi:hypothetical protein